MRFKELRNKLQENWGVLQAIGTGTLNPAVGPHNPDGAVDTPEINIASLNGEALARLNTFLGAAMSKSYINPYNVLAHIKSKLERIGLFFEYRVPPAKTGLEHDAKSSIDNKRGPVNEIGAGMFEFTLKYLGGSYGRYPTDPGYDPYHADNISNKTGTPLKLVVEINSNEDGTFSVNPRIVQSSVKNSPMEQTEVDGEDIVEVQTPLRSKEMKMKYNDAWLQGDTEARKVKKQDNSEKADKKFLYLKGGKKVNYSAQNRPLERWSEADE